MSDERTLIRERPLIDTPLRVRVAPFWLRTVALLIDLVPLLTLYLLVLFASGMVDTSDLPQSRWNTFDMLVDLLNERPLFFVGPVGLLLALIAGYYLVVELAMGSSVGKRLLGFTLVDVGCQRPAAIMVVIRNVVRLVSLLLLGLGYLWAAFDTERRTLHDWVSGTWVVDIRHLPTPK